MLLQHRTTMRISDLRMPEVRISQSGVNALDVRRRTFFTIIFCFAAFFSGCHLEKPEQKGDREAKEGRFESAIYWYEAALGEGDRSAVHWKMAEIFANKLRDPAQRRLSLSENPGAACHRPARGRNESGSAPIGRRFARLRKEVKHPKAGGTAKSSAAGAGRCRGGKSSKRQGAHLCGAIRRYLGIDLAKVLSVNRSVEGHSRREPESVVESRRTEGGTDNYPSLMTAGECADPTT